MYKFLFVLGFLACSASAYGSRREIMNHKNWELIPTKKCGISKHQNRIVNGETAKQGQFPWIAQIFAARTNFDQFICGGALINQRYILTAGHCVHRNEKRIKKVRLGKNTVIHMRTFCVSCLSKTYKVENITLHPEYNETSFQNDIALIRLDEPVEYNLFTRPICLPMDDVLEEEFIAEKVDIAGWGKDSLEEYSAFLKSVRIPIRDKCVCNHMYERQLDDGQFCAGVSSGADSCEGDSGGPMMWNRREGFINKHYTIGVVSYGKEACGEAPAVYTNVVHYIKWILDNIYDKENFSVESNENTDTAPASPESSETSEMLESLEIGV